MRGRHQQQREKGVLPVDRDLWRSKPRIFLHQLGTGRVELSLGFETQPT